jgi:threonine synthase
MGTVRCLKCRECNREYEPGFRYICEDCFGPIDVEYETPSALTRDLFSKRQEKSYWRYFELLPIANKSNIISLSAGFTPLQIADRLGEEIGS